MATAHPILDAAATTVHNDHVLAQEQRLRNWQLTTWWTLAFCLVLVVSNCVQWLTRKEHYLLYQLDGLGISRYVSEMSVTATQSMPVKMLVVQNFIRGIRVVSTDQQFQEDAMNTSYFLCREKAQSYLRDYFSHPENDPKPLQKKGISRIPLGIEVAPQTETTFHVTWEEDTQEVTGTVRMRWSAVVTLETKDPALLTGEERKHSPLGLFITYVTRGRGRDRLRGRRARYNLRSLLSDRAGTQARPT